MAFDFDATSSSSTESEQVVEASHFLSQIIEAEACCIPDSNYLMLNRKKLLQILPEPYQQPLPDRYVSLSVLGALGGSGYFVSSALLGCSRFDYRSRAKALHYKPSDYVDSLNRFLPPEDMVANFGFARAKTLRALKVERRGRNTIADLSDYELYQMALEGHLGELKYASPYKRFIAEVRFRSALILLMLAALRKGVTKNLLKDGLKNCALVITAPRLLLISRFKHHEAVDKTFGDKLAANHLNPAGLKQPDKTLFIFKATV